jgi:coproporphyrinogen III oxidase-like Fe-S oxidoreductase|tara:strand:- start:1334 stop:1582 length:249 start_codon:yes stop_codon:yes gene_type:complete
VIAYIDRSLTVEMLDYYIEKDEISVQDIYKIEELSSVYLIEKRLEEQQNSGLIKINKDILELTSRGRVVGLVYKYLGILYEN